jgi:hypothetical protein
MRDMINVAFQQAWFGPFSLPMRTPHNCRKIIGPMGEPVYQDPECYEHAGPVYDIGPLNGLMTTSMLAQQMAQIPIVNYAQARPRFGGAMMGDTVTPDDRGLCPPGTMPVSSGVPGQPSKCVKWSPPSNMIGPSPVLTVNSQVPASYTPNQLTYPVTADYAWGRRGM